MVCCKSGDPADFLIADGLEDFVVRETYIDGMKVAAAGCSLVESVPSDVINRFNCSAVSATDLAVIAKTGRVRAIRVIPGSLITEEEIVDVSGC